MTEDFFIIAPEPERVERTPALIGLANCLEGNWAYIDSRGSDGRLSRSHLVRVTASKQTAKTLCNKNIFRAEGLALSTDLDMCSCQVCDMAVQAARRKAGVIGKRFDWGAGLWV